MVFFALLFIGERFRSPPLQAVQDVLLFEVVPYYLKWLDGVCVLLAVSHREDGKH